MTNENTQPTPQNDKPEVPVTFGTKLKQAREALHFTRKEAASHLRLNEKIIIMMEKERYPADLPATFIRGYIRAYGKLLELPEYEIKKAIEPIKPKQVNSTINLALPPPRVNYFMQTFTYLIILTLIALVASWWYTHQTNGTPAKTWEAVLSPIKAITAPANNAPPVVETIAEKPLVTATPIHKKTTASTNKLDDFDDDDI